MPKKNLENRKILDYVPAQIYDTKSVTYVGYYVKNPTSGEMKRKRIRVNRIKNKRERIRYARKIMIEVNKKLAAGWNPFLEQEAPKSFTLLRDAIDTYIEVKTKELRPDSIRSYKSNIEMFFKYLENLKKTDIYVLNVSQDDAKQYLNYLYLEKNYNEKTHNGQRGHLKTFWFWLIENGYSNVNVFEGTKKKKEKTKSRIIIAPDIRKKIFDYFEERKEYEFLAICYLTFYGLIRPRESLLLKRSDILFDKSIIKIRAEVSKIGKERFCTVPKKVLDLLKFLKIDKLDNDVFVFGKDFKPNKIAINSRYIGKRWFIMREDLGFAMNIQFYGLKDTGIVEMLRAGVSPEAVRDQAGHSSLEMTNRYVQIARLGADQQILDKVNY